MAVLFVCPEDGCGSRGFDEPREGGTSLICTRHISGPVKLVQYEVTDVVQKSHAAVRAPGQGEFGEGTGDIPTNNFLKRDEHGNQIPLVNDPKAVELAALRAELETLRPGTKVDRRMGEEKLRAQVEAAREEAAERASNPDQEMV